MILFLVEEISKVNIWSMLPTCLHDRYSLYIIIRTAHPYLVICLCVTVCTCVSQPTGVINFGIRSIWLLDWCITSIKEIHDARDAKRNKKTDILPVLRNSIGIPTELSLIRDHYFLADDFSTDDWIYFQANRMPSIKYRLNRLRCFGIKKIIRVTSSLCWLGN